MFSAKPLNFKPSNFSNISAGIAQVKYVHNKLFLHQMNQPLAWKRASNQIILIEQDFGKSDMWSFIFMLLANNFSNCLSYINRILIISMPIHQMVYKTSLFRHKIAYVLLDIVIQLYKTIEYIYCGDTNDVLSCWK